MRDDKPDDDRDAGPKPSADAGTNDAATMPTAGRGMTDAQQPSDEKDSGPVVDHDAGPMPTMDGGGLPPTDAGSDAMIEDTGGPAREAVIGKVIDYNRNPVPNVTIRIGDAVTTTDDEGAFTIDEVAETYDVSISISVPHYGDTQAAAWLYVGLTRRDPTLQVYRGLPLRQGDFTLSTQGVTYPLAAGEHTYMGYAGPYGDQTYGLDVMALADSLSWEGPAAVLGTAHALRWTASTTSPLLPLSYLAHDEQPLMLDDNTTHDLMFDLSSTGPMAAGTISGSVTTGPADERHHDVYVRFDDNAVIQVVDDWSEPQTFSYLVPSLPNASLTVAATARIPGVAVAYVDGIAPGTSSIELDVPSPALLVAPAAGSADVTGETEFAWTGPEQVYMLYAESEDYYESFYVVTAELKAQLPVPPISNLPLLGNEPYVWQVQTHDQHATVDDATGPDGLFDAYCTGRVSGPRRGDGTHTESPWFSFTAAP